MADEESTTTEETTTADSAETGNVTGQNDGESGAEQEAVSDPTFTQADVDKIVKERLERERAKQEKAAEKAKREAEEKALEEQGKFKELNEQLKAELEQIKAEKQAAELAMLKAKIGQKHSLPQALIDRLKGETEEELEEDAQALIEALPAPQVSGTDATNGMNTRKQPTPTMTDQEIRERAARLGVSFEHLKQHYEKEGQI